MASVPGWMGFPQLVQVTRDRVVPSDITFFSVTVH